MTRFLIKWRFCLIMVLILAIKTVSYLRYEQWKRVDSLLVRTARRSARNRSPVSCSVIETFDEPQVTIKSSLKKVKIDEEKIRHEVNILRKILKIEDLGLDIMFISEQKIRALNEEWRSIDKSTDVLSFPMHEFFRPEKFRFRRKDLAGTVLGEIIFAPSYIQKRMDEDQQYYLKYGTFDNAEDRGVSKEMATKFSLEERIPLLMIHSLLHLLGYDHETDSDWLVMTAKEDDVMSQFYTIMNQSSTITEL